jgi:hypothetical protein
VDFGLKACWSTLASDLAANLSLAAFLFSRPVPSSDPGHICLSTILTDVYLDLDVCVE